MIFKRSALIIAILIYFNISANGQIHTIDSTVTSPEFENAVAFYKKEVGNASPLYSGRQYLGYDYRINGHQYFAIDEPIQGSLLYNGVFYDDVLMRYELVQDDLMVTYPGNEFKIIIKKADIDWFHIDGHLFKKFETGQLSGFYDIIYNSKQQVLVKRTKILEEEIRDQTLNRQFVQKNQYYIKNGEEVYPVSSKRSLLNYFENDKREIRKMLKKGKVKYRKDPENTILRTMEYMKESSS